MSSAQDKIAGLSQQLRSLQTKIEVRRASRIDGIETSLLDVEKQESDNQIMFEARTQTIAESFLQINKKIEECRAGQARLEAEFEERLTKLQEDVKILLAKAIQERQESQEVLARSIEDAFSDLRDEIASQDRQKQDQTDGLCESIRVQLSNLRAMIADEGDTIKSTEGRVRDFVDKAFGSVEKKLHEEDEKGIRSEKAIRDLVGLVEKQFERDFKKLREERKAGEDALVDLLEKMTNNFIALAD